MRRDRAEKLALDIRASEPEADVRVERVSGASPDPFGYVLLLNGARISSPAEWSALENARAESDTYKLVLRLPSVLGAAIRQLAQEHRRSINAELETAVAEYVERNL